MKDFFGRKFQLPLRKKANKREDQNQEEIATFSNPLSKLQAFLPVYSLTLKAYSVREKQSNGETPIWVRFHFLHYPLPWPRLLLFLYSRRVKENKGSVLVAQLVLSWRMHVIRMFFVHNLCSCFCLLSQVGDLKLDGKLCSLPGSHAFGFGIAALLCLLFAQIMGNLIICLSSCLREKRGSCKSRAAGIAKILLFFSW